jgi:hypothetical protein
VEAPFELAVILAESQANHEVAPVLAAIDRACAGIRTEVLVVRPAGRPGVAAPPSLSVRELVAGTATLVPDRWGIGVRACAAPVFACLTTELTPHADWATRLLAALQSGAVAASGSITLSPHASARATALYLVRFNAFLPRRNGENIFDTRNIPGDSAAYLRSAVERYPQLLAEGFWEADFHRRFAADGLRMVFIPEALCTFNSALPLRAAWQLRRQHAFGFGVTRVTRLGERVSRVLLAGPLVPFVMVARTLRRASASPGATRLAVRSLPALFSLCVAWAWGEMQGAWHARNGGA